MTLFNFSSTEFTGGTIGNQWYQSQKNTIVILETPMTISNQDSNPLDPNPEKAETNFRIFTNITLCK